MDERNTLRARQIADTALALVAELRTGYLDQECQGDRDLREAAEKLLPAREDSATIAISDRSTGLFLLPDGHQVAQYKILGTLGVGGMGAVYKAADSKLGRTVALKVLRPERDNWIQRERFAREARAASALNHPSIITIYEFSTDAGLDYIAMEYVEGETLSQLLDRKHVARRVLLNYATQTAVALDKAHAAGIVHRDLKPGNIMVTRDGLVKVLDFGLARHHAQDESNTDNTLAMSLTVAGAVLGTPSYMSPEQVIGETVDHRSDIFSFGIILYEIACGQRPFRGANQQATVHRIATAEPMSPAAIDPSVPPGLARLIERCLKKDREQRPQRMSDVAAELAALAVEEPSAPQPSRRPLLLGGLAVAILGVAAGSTRWWLGRSEAVRLPPRSLAVSILAQHMQDGKPAGEPYAAALTETFRGGWRFKLHVRPASDGHLYVINDGPDERGGDRLWVLYPASPEADGAVAAGRDAETGWYVFDRTPGAEKLWLVWAKQPLPGVRSGRVDDQAAARTLRELLTRGRRQLVPGAGNEFVLAGLADTMTALLELRHGT